MRPYEEVILALEDEASGYPKGSTSWNALLDGCDSIRILMGDIEKVLEANKELTALLSKKVQKAGSKPARKKNK